MTEEPQDSETRLSALEAEPAFRWLAESKRYLLAAEVLRESDDYKRGKLLITPTLHLVAHGIELFLKGTLLRSGLSETDVRKFGHDIHALWNHALNATTRDEILSAASEEWEAARQNPDWLDDFGAFDKAPFEEYLQHVNELHSRDSDFALRYVTGRTPDTAGPRPHLLSATFYRVVDRYLRDMINSQ